MSFASVEQSVEGAQPVEIFEIVAGSTTYYYTSSEVDETILSQTYTSVAGLKSSSIEESSEVSEQDYQFELPTSDPLAAIFRGNLPGFRVSVIASKFHRTDTPTPEVVQIFDGFVQSASFNKKAKTTKLTCRDALAALGRQIPRRFFMSSCNFDLYDALTCKVDDTDPAFRASALAVASQVGAVLTVTSGLSGTYTDGWMNAGYVETVVGSDFRLILAHTGNAVTLLLPFTVAPASVNVFAGCAHNIGICKSKFDNVVNYGGFAFVPTRNIHADRIQ